MKKLLIVISVFILLIFCSRWFFYETNVSKDNRLIIAGKPDSVVYRSGKLDSLQIYKEGSTKNWERDLRRYDPSSLDLKNNLPELLHSDFDSKTNWPKSLPSGFNPDTIMEKGKNPGLNIRKLHKEGITGKGIGIAIIDQNLLVDHCEYKDQLRMYEEIHIQKLDHSAQMHGPAVASIAVGKTVGVAPEADLYYISSWDGSLFAWIKYKLFNSRDINPKWMVKSIYRVLEINRTLPLDKKIRVISISFGSDRRNFLKAIKDASKEGVFVISSSLNLTHNLKFQGLGRECLSNPDDFNSYLPGSWWAKMFYKNPEMLNDSTLLLPMDSRCTASQSGEKCYVFYSNGGWSWSIPYVAGLYALACQVKPNVTPHEFWKISLETGNIIELDKDGKKYKLGKIVNPVKLIESLRKSMI
jgi:hypothetical protein